MFKNRVQDLIDQNMISFTEEKPNVKAKPWPNHHNQTMNDIIKEDIKEVIHLVEDVNTQWSVISKSMQKHSALEGVYDNFEVCKTKPERCKELKNCI